MLKPKNSPQKPRKLLTNSCNCTIYTCDCVAGDSKQYLDGAGFVRRMAYICLIMAFLVILWVGMAHSSDNIDMTIIAQIESSNNSKAYNSRSGAIGLCQVTPGVLKDYNKEYRTYHPKEQLFNATFNMYIADWYMNNKIPRMLKHDRIEDTIKNRLWAYNAGINNVVNGIFPKETTNYINKYMGA